MGFSSAIDLWDEWKLRILVLCSLCVQFLLFLAGYARTAYILRRLRVIVWLAYIAGDALAVYALATLFNRQKLQQAAADGGGGSSALEVIWAPVLLIHLGGQTYISAYSLEDNELWKRHAITLVSQVTVALYVFCKWWSGEKRLLQAAILLFIAGILRFGQKPWALRRASYGSMASTYLSSSPALQIREEGIDNSLQEYVRRALQREEGINNSPALQGWRKRSDDEARQEKFDKDHVFKMFLDLSAPYSVRLHYLKSFPNLDEEKQHIKLRKWIDWQFSAVYTRFTSAVTCLGFCTFFMLPSLTLASVILYAMSDKDGYSNSDITVTYILFFGMVVMELAPFFIRLGIYLFPCDTLANMLIQALRWQDMVSQHNIMSFCARERKPTALMELATFGYLRDYINKHWYIWHEPAAPQISVLVRRHAEEDGWKEYIRDAATYRRFNNFRGDHTLRKHKLLGQEQVGRIMNLPFDECVLLWHIASDLCLHHTSSSTDNITTASSSQSQHTIESRRRSSEIISNYMVYLLFICPDMLILGTRQDLFKRACDDIELMLEDESLLSLPDERSTIAQQILGMEQGDQLRNKAPRISNALKLARVLIDLNEEERWEVIQGVWVEMLCYSASRCAGYQHAKSLAHGGEYLTNVWLLWSCMGMETLPDKIHNPGPPEPDPAQE